MVQIVEGFKRPSAAARFAKGLSQTAPDALGRYFEQQRENNQLEAENAALEAQGANVRGVKDPAIRRALLAEAREKSGREEEQSRTRSVLGEQFDPSMIDRKKAFEIYQANPALGKIAFALAEENEQRPKLEDERARQKAVTYDYLTTQLNMDPEEAYSISENVSPEEAKALFPSPQMKAPPKKPSPSQLQKDVQKDIATAIKEIPQIQGMMQAVDRAEELVKDLSGVFGYGKALFGTPEAAELEALGPILIQPALKILNPVGAIPQVKINTLLKRLAISPYDTTRTAMGKISALRQFANLAQLKSQRYVDLLQEYGEENIPYEELLKFSAENESVVDAINGAVQQTEKPKTSAKSPKEGSRRRSKKTGVIETWNGKDWVPEE